MPFEVFMAACLYDPNGGFFATGPLRSTKSGDFLTSPEVSPWFGRTIARHVESERARLGRTDPFQVAEIGAGSGSLIDALHHGLSEPHPEIWAADMSPAAQLHLGEILHDDRVVDSLDDMPASITGFIVANELLDNLPVALALRAGETWQERVVGVNDHGKFVLTPGPARPEVAAWADSYATGTPDGGLVEVQLAACDWVRSALRRLDRGSLVVIDYGGTAEELVPRRTQGTLRTYRAHHLGPDPLDEPGKTDVTVDVNFTALAAVAEDEGVTVEIDRQDEYLTRWGLRDVVSDLRQRELAEARDGDPVKRLQLRSERTDAETLLHPRGLGDFRVLVATK